MKRQSPKWGKIIDTYIINKGLVCRLYFKNYINQWEKGNLIIMSNSFKQTQKNIKRG